MSSKKLIPVQIEFTLEFKRNVRRLSRRYPHIRTDVDPVIAKLAAGDTPGDRIKRTGYTVFKVRIKNSDARRGKSGGYRMLYYIKTEDRVILVTLYSKSDQGDITADVVCRIISEYESEARGGRS